MVINNCNIPILAACTTAVKAFCPGYFSHFVSGLEPRQIGVRPKGTHFGLGCYPKP